jgi:putative ABC transport system permease protein
MTELIPLDLLDLALALALIGMAIALSRWQQVGLEGQLAIAAARTLLQLIVAGYALAFIFALDRPIAVLIAILVMVTIAAIAAQNRISQKIKHLFPLVWGSLLASSALTLSYIIIAIVQPPVWYSPQYLIPLAGMVIGNAMDTATLAGERLVSTIDRSTLEIETHLSLGATPAQAVFRYRTEAIRAGLIPLINRMMMVGLVTLPGLLTGQVLAGADPLNAVLYQILILFAIAFANFVAVLLVTQGIARQFFNVNAQLRNYEL